MANLPEGVTTFVFTDVEGSTRLWEDAPESMMEALNQHDEIIETVIAGRNGFSVKPRGEGDSRFLVFSNATSAVGAIAEIQTKLDAADWPTPRPIRIRVSIHTGKASLEFGDYYGSVVNRAARLRGIGHGGQTLMSRATWELVQDSLPDGVSVLDMGEHGLKDLTRPEHVFQINIEGLDSEFPPLKSLDSVPNNLPEQLTEFIGRDTELTRAKQLVGETRLLTILAPGGTGKTRLGIQAAADLISEFPDGVFFVALADLDSSSEIVQSIAEALGVGLSSDEDPKSQLLTYLSNKTQLLVVDNFEHIADGAVIISEILEAGPAVRIVATSRVKLNLSGETVLTLGGLSSTWDTLQEAMQTGGVQLFLAAALRADSGFTLQAGDLDSVAEILRLTGGSPLGILLAAAWVDMLPVSEIAAEVAQSLDFFETEMGDVPDRHRSVRAVFDYSWGLLGEEEKEMYAALSVFRGGFTREAAASVAGASLRNLATLLNKSLVTSSVDKSRYSVHELLRQYASDELDKVPERSRAVSEAHGATYGDLMEDAGEIITRSDQPAFLASVDQDIDNVRSAWRYYLSTGNAESAARFPAGLYHIYEVRGWYTAGTALFEEALEAFEVDSHDEAAIAVRAISAAIQGSFLSLLGQPSVGTAAALEAWDALPDSASDLFRWLTAQCIGLGMAYLGTTDDMAAVFDRAMEIANRDDPVWKAGMKNWRSFTALLAGDIETARVLVPEAMEVLEARGDHYYMTWNFWLQAMMATMDGRLDDAVDLYARQVARAEEIGYLRGKVVAFEGLGDASVAAGRLDAAETAFVRGIEVAEQMGMVRDMLGMMTKVANVWSAMERRPEAVELLGSVCADPISAQQPFTANVLWSQGVNATSLARVVVSRRGGCGAQVYRS